MTDKKPLALKPSTPRPAAPEGPPWTVLVVDDDPEVHEVTRLILGRMRYRDRGVRILSAHSGPEGRALLERNPDTAVILLDVVMETDDAGLRLARAIREDLGNEAVRIILRTGQPGQAPEESVILDYDINDYKAKTELTAQKLFTAVITALRSYGHIVALDANRRGLEKILHSASELFRIRSMQRFATGVLTQLSAFLGCAPNGILCVQNTDSGGDRLRVLAGVGEFEGCPGCRFATDCGHWQDHDLIRRALETRSTIFEERHTVLFIETRDSRGTAVLVHAAEPVSTVDRQLLELFAAKISLGFENVLLYENLEELVVERTRELQTANRELARLATIDPLTGAHNRRSFMARLQAEVARAARGGHPLSVLAVDLDHFKTINDTHGHAGGDEVLKSFVETAGALLRPADVVGRLGGEEFAVLLPDTALSGAIDAGERLRAGMEALAVAGGVTPIRFTISVGVAQHGPDGATPETVLSMADKRLYAAKHQGRNRVAAEDLAPVD